ncbi:hypothetical protein R1flu_016584 [Riccia fluitans]|uniref:Uncharacterized protein n=1 Tax=Riccia fluitans TaxID=41844 RepID=A0ABD1YMS8_9MARC
MRPKPLRTESPRSRSKSATRPTPLKIRSQARDDPLPTTTIGGQPLDRASGQATPVVSTSDPTTMMRSKAVADNRAVNTKGKEKEPWHVPLPPKGPYKRRSGESQPNRTLVCSQRSSRALLEVKSRVRGRLSFRLSQSPGVPALSRTPSRTYDSTTGRGMATAG